MHTYCAIHVNEGLIVYSRQYSTGTVKQEFDLAILNVKALYKNIRQIASVKGLYVLIILRLNGIISQKISSACTSYVLLYVFKKQ